MTQRERRPKGERTRQAILRAAERRFAAHGFAETRLEDVAADIGLAPSAVLYHFNDKRGLYRAVLDQLFTGLLEDLSRILVGPASLTDRVASMVGAVVQYTAEHPEVAHLTLREASATSPNARKEIQSRVAPFLQLLTQVLNEGETTSAIQPQRADAFHLASIVAGALIFYVAALPTFVATLPYDHLAPDQVQALKDEIADLTLRLLGIAEPRRAKSESAKHSVTHQRRPSRSA
jgi:TetR/AcrR family transcriptional regulator